MFLKLSYKLIICFLLIISYSAYSDDCHNLSKALIERRERINAIGNNGGAYRVVVKSDEESFNAVEKQIAPARLSSLSEEDYDKFLELSSSISTFAGEKGLGPEVFGFKDSVIGSRKVRFLYMAEVKRVGGDISKLTEEKISKLKERVLLIKSFHPDFHLNNIIFEFYDNFGELDVRATGIDWDHPYKTIKMLTDILEKLKNYN